MPQKSNIHQNLEQRARRFIRLALKEISVELKEEFDRNFEREAFFNERWARRKHNHDKSRGLLSQSGALRRSIKEETRENSVLFSSDLPYATIHNQGGVIRVTEKMKRYFWYQYMQATASFTFRKDGKKRQNSKNRTLDAVAGFYKAMALKKVGSTIVIPRRRFIGKHPQLEKSVLQIIEQCFAESFETNEWLKEFIHL